MLWPAKPWFSPKPDLLKFIYYSGCEVAKKHTVPSWFCITRLGHIESLALKSTQMLVEALHWQWKSYEISSGGGGLRKWEIQQFFASLTCQNLQSHQKKINEWTNNNAVAVIFKIHKGQQSTQLHFRHSATRKWQSSPNSEKIQVIFKSRNNTETELQTETT